MLVLVIAMLLIKDEQVHGLEQRAQAAKCGVSGSPPDSDHHEPTPVIEREERKPSADMAYLLQWFLPTLQARDDNGMPSRLLLKPCRPSRDSGNPLSKALSQQEAWPRPRSIGAKLNKEDRFTFRRVSLKINACLFVFLKRPP